MARVSDDKKRRVRHGVNNGDAECTLEDSYKRMWTSYDTMLQGYESQQKEAINKPKWVSSNRTNAQEPHPLTVTHINHAWDLLRVEGLETGFAEEQSTIEWLKSHSVEYLKLTLKDMVVKGSVGRPRSIPESGKTQQHIEFEAGDIHDFEYKLNLAIEMYTKRIKWLLQGSRKMFGLVKGERLAVLVDMSDANCGFGRLANMQQSLAHLMDEQLEKKSGLYLATFGTDIHPLWPAVMETNCRVVQQAKEWVSALTSCGGCNLLKALKHVHGIRDIETVLLILGSVPDQAPDVLCAYMEQLGLQVNLPIQAVSFDCSNQQTSVALQRLAEQTGGRYHCYSAASEEQIYTGTDITLLLKEVKKAQAVVMKIKEMRQGLLGTALVTVHNEISTEVAKLPPARFMPRPPGHELPLRLEQPKFKSMSSAEWLAKYGLKARGLDLYQVLAPNAFSFREEFVPIIRKTVQSQVHAKAMARFEWHDGSIKNVHVDMSQLFEYQKKLGAAVKVLEKRIEWLSSASRRIMGTIMEEKFVILLDLSQSNEKYLVHIQHSLRLLMEQQLLDKQYFNIICFGGKIQSWKPTMVKPTPENLQEAWAWVLGLHCGGSRDFMGALRLALENDEEHKHHIEVDGIYVFCSGVPDQAYEVCQSYIEEACAGRPLHVHTILFNVDDYDPRGPIPGRYANITKTAECLRSLAHCSNGRFHWFRETGIIESDDISAMSLEIEKALNFSKKCAMLVDSVKKKYGLEDEGPIDFRTFSALRDAPKEALPEPTPLKALMPPRHTALSQARMQGEKDTAVNVVDKPSGWRPSTAAKRDEVEKLRRPNSASDPLLPAKAKRVQQAFFYTGDKRTDIGSTFTQYPGTKSVRKAVKMTSIPEEEEQFSTKEWMYNYSLKRLKLDLHKLVSGPDCRHVSKPVRTLQKNAEAIYCNIFPTINIEGVQRHLQLLPHELVQYEQEVEIVLRRYLKRLQWLLSGSRKTFGTITEDKSIILVDTSGSMGPYMEELKSDLSTLIWEQLYKNKIKFNLIRFSNDCESWRPQMVDATEKNCHQAVQWASNTVANNNTCTLEALQMALSDPEVRGIYLFTDGKPDSSTSLVMKAVSDMNTVRQVAINTISFNCNDSSANNFLKMLAASNRGRYHRVVRDFDAALFAHKLLTEGFDDPEHPALPDFESDDLTRLAKEISKARRFISDSRTYRALYEDLRKANDERPASHSEPHSCLTVGPGAKRN